MKSLQGCKYKHMELDVKVVFVEKKSCLTSIWQVPDFLSMMLSHSCVPETMTRHLSMFDGLLKERLVVQEVSALESHPEILHGYAAN